MLFDDKLKRTELLLVNFKQDMIQVKTHILHLLLHFYSLSVADEYPVIPFGIR